MATLAGSAWGTGYWGLGAWGAALPISIEECYPLGPRQIFVRFNTPPQARSPLSNGDVQNLRTWDLTRLDNGEKVNIIGAAQGRTPLEWMLVLLSPIGPSAASHELSGARLRSAGGLPSSPPTVRRFYGVDVSKPVLAPSANRNQLVDLRNDYFFGAGQAIRPDSGGNYEVQAGLTGLIKRILRILTTKPGEWPSDRAFGVGLGVKELARDPGGSRARILEAIQRDPEVADAKVSLEVLDVGVVYVTVKVRTVTGLTGDARFTADDAGMRIG